MALAIGSLISSSAILQPSDMISAQMTPDIVNAPMAMQYLLSSVAVAPVFRSNEFYLIIFIKISLLYLLYDVHGLIVPLPLTASLDGSASLLSAPINSIGSDNTCTICQLSLAAGKWATVELLAARLCCFVKSTDLAIGARHAGG